MAQLVFVLGAGSSKAYGFPTGEELNDEIQTIVEVALNKSENAFEHFQILGAMLREILSSKQDKEALEQFYFQYTHDTFITIDEFLQGRQGNVLKIGKLLISLVILYHEKEEKLTFRKNKDGWYSLFWRQAKESIMNQNVKWTNEVIFLTYNYDRTLEHFLVHNGSSTYIGEYFKELDCVHHIYGSVGLYPRRRNQQKTPFGIDFLNKRDEVKNIVKECCENVLHPSEFALIENCNVVFSKKRPIKDIIKNSRYIFLMGCGFHHANMNALGMSELKESSNRPQIFATGFGLKPYQITKIKNKYPVDNLLDVDCVQFYNEVIADKLEHVIQKYK